MGKGSITVPLIEMRTNNHNPRLFYLRCGSIRGTAVGNKVELFLDQVAKSGGLIFAPAMSLGYWATYQTDSRTLPAVIARANAAGIHFCDWTEG